MTEEADFIKELLSIKHREKAFVKLLDLYQERLYWHIRKLVITHENADDVLQNTFLRIYSGLATFKQKSSLHTWMYRIAYNESLRFLDQQKKKQYCSLTDISATYTDNLIQDSFFDGNEIQKKLHRSILELPEKQRHIFQMKYFDHLKFNEIATILKAKEGTIKSSYYSATKFIEKRMLSDELFKELQV